MENDPCVDCPLATRCAKNKWACKQFEDYTQPKRSKREVRAAIKRMGGDYFLPSRQVFDRIQRTEIAL